MTKLERQIADLDREARTYAKFSHNAAHAGRDADSEKWLAKYNETREQRELYLRAAPLSVRKRWARKPLGQLL